MRRSGGRLERVAAVRARSPAISDYRSQERSTISRKILKLTNTLLLFSSSSRNKRVSSVREVLTRGAGLEAGSKGLSMKDVRDFREGRGKPKVDYYGLEGGGGRGSIIFGRP